MTSPPILEWCEAANDAAFSAPADCAARASKFERRIKWRNVTEYLAGAVVILLFSGTTIAAAYKGELLIAASAGLIVMGCAVVLWQLAKRASNLVRRPEDPCVIHLRRQYSRQYEALRSVPVWYLGPLIPGIVAFNLAITARVADAIGWSAAIKGAAGTFAIVAGVFAAVALLNLIGARHLKRKIDELDAQI
ncbi:hypothetical protein [Erythrobacter sp. MTPC3]|uniref:hypothetical protein n=1 Tax=Erythrobacter sp. MTPC3 TaxID=3056564 RepID=UPI0036F1D99E